MDPFYLLALSIISFMILVMCSVLLLIIKGVTRIVDNARCAALYRAGQNQPSGLSGPSYTMVYKNGKRQETIRIMASTEQEAMTLALKNNIRYDKVLSLTKN